jgi:hypothetical protein
MTIVWAALHQIITQPAIEFDDDNTTVKKLNSSS